jgi:hypothetical protein
VQSVTRATKGEKEENGRKNCLHEQVLSNMVVTCNLLDSNKKGYNTTKYAIQLKKCFYINIM